MSSISMCFKLGCWGSSGPCVLFQCSCHWVMTHAVCKMCLGFFGSYGLLFSIMMSVLLCCVLCAASGSSQRRMGVCYALRVSPAVTRLTAYRRPRIVLEAHDIPRPGSGDLPVYRCWLDAEYDSWRRLKPLDAANWTSQKPKVCAHAQGWKTITRRACFLTEPQLKES